MNMKIIVAKDEKEIGCLAADIYEQLIASKPDCVLGLATGSSPLPLYAELVKRCDEGRIDFSAVRSVNLDEYRGLAPEHPQSYRRFMQENLFDKINIKRENTFVPDGLAEDADAACRAYEDNITSLGGIDLQLLGIGHDGHIGFNEPDDDFPLTTHVVTLTEMTREANERFFSCLDEVPHEAVTMGIGTVMAAKKIIMIVTGAGKADILRQLKYGEVRPELPASVLHLHPDVTVFCDEAAYSKC